MFCRGLSQTRRHLPPNDRRPVTPPGIRSPIHALTSASVGIDPPDTPPASVFSRRYRRLSWRAGHVTVPLCGPTTRARSRGGRAGVVRASGSGFLSAARRLWIRLPPPLRLPGTRAARRSCVRCHFPFWFGGGAAGRVEGWRSCQVGWASPVATAPLLLTGSKPQ